MYWQCKQGLNMAWFMVVLGKDGGEKGGKKKREMPLVYLLEKHVKKEEKWRVERSKEKGEEREQRDK